MSKEDSAQVVAPYIPFKTFQTAIEHLEQGLPEQIDRSIWPTFSGTIQSQMLSTFRFLGLIDDDGRTQPDLEKMVENKDSRKLILKEILQKRYQLPFDLSKGTPRQLDDAIATFNVSGETLRKSVTFFLQAAKEAELPLSAHISKKTRTAPSRKKVAKTRETGKDFTLNTTKKTDEKVPVKVEPLVTASGDSMTIQLKSGGSLTLTISVSLLTIGQEDRNFIFKLIDDLKSYEEKQNDENLSDEID